MHADQVDLTVPEVAELVAAQFPRWGRLPIEPLVSHGTVNALFRLGDDLVLRLPLRPDPSPVVPPDLPRLPLAVPELQAVGAPGGTYPGAWTVYRWIDGEIATPESFGGPDDLAAFVTALHAVDTGGRTWDGRSRGGPLAGQDDEVQEAMARTGYAGRLGPVWARCRDAAPASHSVWIHGDLMPGNLLVRDGRLAAVIDWEALAVGDPAVDLMPAWNLMPAGAREAYRRALQCDDAAWLRGQGWAIVQAIIALPYYAETNPVMAGTARRTLAAVLS